MVLIETQAIRIAELAAMVFGKKKQPPSVTPPKAQDKPSASPKPPRNNDSFKRTIPKAEAVTETIHVPVDHCACGGPLTDITTHDRYIEDIPLPDLTAGYNAKLVTKHLVRRGICSKCGKVISGQDLGGSVVSLGPNVRLLTLSPNNYQPEIIPLIDLICASPLAANGDSTVRRSLACVIHVR
jgi:hypothetical protein